jgi:hypothetical protein
MEDSRTDPHRSFGALKGDVFHNKRVGADQNAFQASVSELQQPVFSSIIVYAPNAVCFDEGRPNAQAPRQRRDLQQQAEVEERLAASEVNPLVDTNAVNGLPTTQLGG